MNNFSQIAPCGMNCFLCMAYQREKNHCPGCNSPEAKKQKHCENCVIKNCPELPEIEGENGKFCYNCEKFPCPRLKQLDKRYRTRYGTSFIENLQTLKESGMEKYLEMEKAKWTCPNCNNLLCIHKEKCPGCDGINKEYPITKSKVKD